MRRPATLLCLAAFACGFFPASLLAQEVIRPFDGTLRGWSFKEVKGIKESKWAVGAPALRPDNPKGLVASPDDKHPALVNVVDGHRQSYDLYSQAKFGDCRIELEVMVAAGANSGIYVMGEYEVQVLDSFGREKLGGGDMGAIYGAAPPRVNACKPAGEWQEYVIDFQAPIFDAAGKKTANAKFLRVELNGQVLHENVEMKGPTPSGVSGREAATGPIMFQGDHGPVAYRNIRVTPLVGSNGKRQPWAPSTSDKPIKVFVLAGQSNMEGRGFPEPLSWQVTQDEFKDRWTHFLENGDHGAFAKRVAATRNPEDRRAVPDYRWSVRRDVWINYLDKHGDLTNGYGAPREGFGPEFDFGHALGDHYDEQVLLIKTSWGGRALDRGFLPPSSMLSDEAYKDAAAKLRDENKTWNAEQEVKVAETNQRLTRENAGLPKDKQKKLRNFRPRPILSDAEYKQQFGKDYRNMMASVKDCIENLGERFPGYHGQGHEFVGFVWFQGWNDQYNDRWLNYEKNLANLIRDVRRELDAPEMKFVIGQMGHDGMKEDKPDSPRDYIKKAQASVPAMNEFKGGAVCVKTDQFWDKDAHAIYTGPGGWSKDVDRWRQHGNDRGYHYYGSPWTFSQIGRAFGAAMVDLVK